MLSLLILRKISSIKNMAKDTLCLRNQNRLSDDALILNVGKMNHLYF